MEPIVNTDIQDIQQESNLNFSKLRMNNRTEKTSKDELMEAAQGFEAIFVTKLLNILTTSFIK